METVPKLKSKTLNPKAKFGAAGRKTAAKTNKTEMVRIEADKAQTKGVAATLLAAEVTNEERQRLIAEAAYFRAERRNFVPGYELRDWLDAEAEIEAKMIKASKNYPTENA